ncbi:MAG TPA: hypothetical protein VFK14_09415 [Solirubrobacterales bacterium]|nr:hypothetical protein [Solirubrobacterales bacterium]
MANDNPRGHGATERLTTAEQDFRDQERVLREVLETYPESFTLAELTRELTIASTDFMERDRIERAVRDLIAGGLLHLVGDLVLPTRAAANFHSLSEV